MRFRTGLIACVLGLLALSAAAPAAAEGLTLMWDPSQDGTVSGYIVYIRMPGTQGNSYDVGQTTSFDWNGALNGQQYYFSVASYRPGPVIGARSPEISRYPDSAPTLTNPGSLSSTVGASVSFQLTGNDPEGAPLTYGASGLPSGLQLTASTGRIAGSPNTPGTYIVTATVNDGGLSAATTFTWTIAQTSSTSNTGSGTTANSGTQTGVTVEQPVSVNTQVSGAGPKLVNPGPQTAQRGAPVNLALTATNSNGAAVNRFAAIGLPTGLRVEAGNGQISGTPVTAGNYLVTATVTDGVLTDVKTFAWTIIPSTVDNTAPVVSIAMPTSAGSYQTTEAFVTLAGTASDDNRVVEVSWSSDRGTAGVASGTDTWIAGIPVLPGSNTITIEARDDAGNVSRKAILVKARLLGTISAPAITQKGKRSVNSN